MSSSPPTGIKWHVNTPGRTTWWPRTDMPWRPLSNSMVSRTMWHMETPSYLFVRHVLSSLWNRREPPSSPSWCFSYRRSAQHHLNKCQLSAGGLQLWLHFDKEKSLWRSMWINWYSDAWFYVSSDHMNTVNGPYCYPQETDVWFSLMNMWLLVMICWNSSVSLNPNFL